MVELVGSLVRRPAVWVDPDTTLRQVAGLLVGESIGVALVRGHGGPAGIVSERDYARKVILLGRSSAETAVWEIMSAPVLSVTSDHTVQECMQLVTERRVRHLPVVEKNQLLGIVSIGDLVRAVIEEQQETITQLEKFITS